MKTNIRKLVMTLAPVIGVSLGAAAFEARAQVNPMAPPTSSNSPGTPQAAPASPNAATGTFTPGTTLPSTSANQAQLKAMNGLTVMDTSGKSWGTISNVTVDSTGEQAMITLDGAEGAKTVTVPLAAALAGQSSSGVTLSTSDLSGGSAGASGSTGTSGTVNGTTNGSNNGSINGVTSGSSNSSTTGTINRTPKTK